MVVGQIDAGVDESMNVGGWDLVHGGRGRRDDVAGRYPVPRITARG
ncbi:hypothetical protein [Nocardia tengchongensis]